MILGLQASTRMVVRLVQDRNGQRARVPASNRRAVSPAERSLSGTIPVI